MVAASGMVVDAGAVAAGGDRRADQLGADGRRVRVGVVGLEVVGPGAVHVAGEHDRVAHAAVRPSPAGCGCGRRGSRPRRPCWPPRPRRTAGRRTPAGRGCPRCRGAGRGRRAARSPGRCRAGSRRPGRRRRRPSSRRRRPGRRGTGGCRACGRWPGVPQRTRRYSGMLLPRRRRGRPQRHVLVVGPVGGGAPGRPLRGGQRRAVVAPGPCRRSCSPPRGRRARPATARRRARPAGPGRTCTARTGAGSRPAMTISAPTCCAHRRRRRARPRRCSRPGAGSGPGRSSAIRR